MAVDRRSDYTTISTLFILNAYFDMERNWSGTVSRIFCLYWQMFLLYNVNGYNIISGIWFHEKSCIIIRCHYVYWIGISLLWFMLNNLVAKTIVYWGTKQIWKFPLVKWEMRTVTISWGEICLKHLDLYSVNFCIFFFFT